MYVFVLCNWVSIVLFSATTASSRMLVISWRFMGWTRLWRLLLNQWRWRSSLRLWRGGSSWWGREWTRHIHNKVRKEVKATREAPVWFPCMPTQLGRTRRPGVMVWATHIGICFKNEKKRRRRKKEEAFANYQYNLSLDFL